MAREMQGYRNKFDDERRLESGVISVLVIYSYASPIVTTSHCPDPTVAMACV
jgi:hypothetical protein